MLEGHGNNGHCFDVQIQADFSTNVFNNPNTTLILNHLKEQVDCIKNYPNSNCTALRTKIAERIDLKSDNILICNGSTEAFYLIAHAYRTHHSVIPVPSFSEYEDACKLHKHKLEFISTSTDLLNHNLKDKLVWIGNPNNPDGRYFSKAYLSALKQANPNSLFIIDEAYIELCTKGESVVELVKEFPKLIVIKSFTKTYSIPGIRLGYVVANVSIIEALKKHHMPWAVNSLALKAGEFIVDNFVKPSSEVIDLIEDSQKLQQEISQIDGFEPLPSPCNYFSVRLKKGNAAELQNFLVSHYGILIRNAENFRGLDESWIRIASCGAKMDSKLVFALKDWAKNKN